MTPSSAIRYLLAAPLTLVTLLAFGLYFGVRNAGYFREGIPAVLWGLTAGLLTAVTNPLYNVTVGTFIFWQWPPWRNDRGEFSPFFTTRLKTMRGHPLAEHMIDMIETFDPGHFAPRNRGE